MSVLVSLFSFLFSFFFHDKAWTVRELQTLERNVQTFATVGVAVSKIAIQLEYAIHGDQMVGQQEMGLGKSQEENH